jgi:hypothetical protein
MIAAQVGEKLSRGSGTPSSYILVAMTDTLDGFREVLALPLQLRLTLRLEWDHVHVGLSILPLIVRGSAADVKSYLMANFGFRSSSSCFTLAV